MSALVVGLGTVIGTLGLLFVLQTFVGFFRGPTRLEVPPEEPGAIARLLGEVPRGRVVLVILVVLANLVAVTWHRGCVIAERRPFATVSFRARPPRPSFVPPWEWTVDEWRETWGWR